MSDTRASSSSTSNSASTPSEGLYDPWKPQGHNNYTPHQSTPQLFEHEDTLEGHIEVSQQSPSRWKWLCCSCCSTHRVTYSRTSQGVTDSEQITSLTPEEESAFLLDCDELGLTWDKDRDKTSNI